MKKVLFSLSAVALIAFTSCEKKEAVAVSDSEEVATATEEAVNYTVDTDVSNVEWRGYKIYEGETEEQGHHGTIKLTSGDIQTEGNQIIAGNFVIDATTLESMDLVDSPEDKANLENHLKSADFLDVETYPSPTFNITKVTPIEGEYNTEISGNLKMREVEKNITFKANTGVDGEVLKIASEEFTINRQDFGITFNPTTGSVIKDNVTLSVNVTANQNAVVEVTDGATTEEVVDELQEEAAH
ncbi:YceI family protein [Flavobacteriaceae bacterium Ap0902]|nr:YceI family protein [Flavobacteriaceae bacterium Ap0902]